MTFKFNDLKLELDDGSKVRETADGYLAAMPRVARTGIQLYAGKELGRPDKKVLRIYRDESEVFSKDSLASFAGKPITDDHPPELVDATNWKKHSVGVMGNDILRDGDYVRVPMILMDKKMIDKVRGGKVQISAGYVCDMDWTPGKTADGEEYDGRQIGIKINHGAIVDEARGGDALSFGDRIAMFKGLEAIRDGKVERSAVLDGADTLLHESYPFMKNGKVYLSALRDARTKAERDKNESALLAVDIMLGLINGNKTETHAMKTMLVDGITCEMSDTAIEVVTRALGTLRDSNAALTKQVTEGQTSHEASIKTANEQIAKLTTEGATKDAKIATLETQLKDAALTPAKLDELVKDRQVVVDKARSLLATVVVDGKTLDEIRQQVVVAKLGDTAKGWDAGQVKVSFDTLTANVTVDAGLSATRHAFSSAPPSPGDITKSYEAYDKRITEAWKTPAGKA